MNLDNQAEQIIDPAPSRLAAGSRSATSTDPRSGRKIRRSDSPEVGSETDPTSSCRGSRRDGERRSGHYVLGREWSSLENFGQVGGSLLERVCIACPGIPGEGSESD